MNYDALYEQVEKIFQKNEFTLKRFAHIESVIKMSLELNRYHQFGIDEEKLKITALLHDYAKQVPKVELEAYLPEVVKNASSGDYSEEIKKIPPLWHSFIGALWVERDFGITDPEILEAIRYHTTGKPGMSLLAQVLYVADTIEELRTYENVVYFRTLAFQNFNECLLEILKETQELNKRKGNLIHPLSRDTYLYFKKEKSHD